jgi:hypothetical protein
MGRIRSLRYTASAILIATCQVFGLSRSSIGSGACSSGACRHVLSCHKRQRVRTLGIQSYTMSYLSIPSGVVPSSKVQYSYMLRSSVRNPRLALPDLQDASQARPIPATVHFHSSQSGTAKSRVAGQFSCLHNIVSSTLQEFTGHGRELTSSGATQPFASSSP